MTARGRWSTSLDWSGFLLGVQYFEGVLLVWLGPLEFEYVRAAR